MSMKTKKRLEDFDQIGLDEKSSYSFRMNRRTFFEVLGSGIAVTFTISQSIGNTWTDVAPEDQIGAWIHIGEDGKVTIYTGKAEVGQNIRTSLAQIVAEELHVPMEKIDMVMGDTALTPYDRGTFGSRSIPYMGPQLRKAAASAREILIDMAAQEWKVGRDKVVLEGGVIKNGTTNHSMPIGQLTKGQKLLKPIDDKVAVTPVDGWKVPELLSRKSEEKHLLLASTNMYQI